MCYFLGVRFSTLYTCAPHWSLAFYLSNFSTFFLIQELQAKTEQICEMAAVMAQAIYIDDEAIQQEQEKMASIESENKGLRELLKISGISFPEKAASEEEASPKQDPESTCTTIPTE